MRAFIINSLNHFYDKDDSCMTDNFYFPLYTSNFVYLNRQSENKFKHYAIQGEQYLTFTNDIENYEKAKYEFDNLFAPRHIAPSLLVSIYYLYNYL